MGLTLEDLDGLEYGLVLDMMTESANDGYNWRQVATQEDMNRF